MKKIIIKTKDMSVEAELKDTPTAEIIFKSLPLEGNANVWGDEIYFEIPLDLELEPEAQEEVEIGDLAYWPSGTAFCIFFGPTPVSTDERPRAYSPVNVFGKITEDAILFKNVSQGEKIQVTAYQ
jgi:hypothetical protein